MSVTTIEDITLSEYWKNVQIRLRKQYGDSIFESWFKGLSLSHYSNHTVYLNASTRFVRDWIMTHYAEQIRSFWTSENNIINDIEVILQKNVKAAPLSLPENPPNVPKETPIKEPKNQSQFTSFSEASSQASSTYTSSFNASFDAPDKEEWSAELDPRLTFDNFVVGKPNELAHAAARRVAEATAVHFNPLFLYGGVGLGKTHLMHAIAWHIRATHPERRVLYVSAEKFMYRFIRALRFKDTMSFKEQFRSVDVLMIDDVQFISGKDSTQEEFFHTFNALVDQNRQIIVSADKSPSDLEGMEERLKSRLGWGLVADIHPTTYELRLGILQSKTETLKIKVPQKVLELLASKITSNVRELEGALNRLAAHAELVGRELTLESVTDTLRDLFRANDKRLTIDDIQKRVSEHFGIRLLDMHSARRLRTVVRPRQVAMYLSKQFTTHSLPEIGRKFGGRDHTTVMHAVETIEKLRASDPSLEEDINLLKRGLEPRF